MKVEFFSSDPRHKARSKMEFVMNQGSDQLAIATGFCSAAGVALLLAHTRRLASRDSFVVVPSAPPTDYLELSKLHAQIPNNLFVHWGALSPTEKKIGAALMHSKVIFARSGQNCWLWTGSHNFTGNATQGGNCEAAVLIQGVADEQPFVDALSHLVACRSEATLYDPDTLPPNDTKREDILVLHVEQHFEFGRNLPCRIHLCLNSPDFDELLAAPVTVRLFLYRPGALARGWQDALPSAAFSGVLTGVNLTGRNPKTGRGGTTAEWSAADFNIEENNDGILLLTHPGPPTRGVATQAVLSIVANSDPNEALFSERPRVEQRSVPGTERVAAIDLDMRKFFRSADVQPHGLLHVPIVRREQFIRVAEGDVRSRDFDRIRTRIAGRQQIGIESETLSDERLRRRHPFIVRAKYRLSDGE